jgi:hypothetical protein
MRYMLYIREGSEWHKIAEFDADNNADAFGKGLSQLPRKHFHKPMALTSSPMECPPPAKTVPRKNSRKSS